MYPLGNVWTHCLRVLNVSSMCPPGKCPLAPSVPHQPPHLAPPELEPIPAPRPTGPSALWHSTGYPRSSPPIVEGIDWGWWDDEVRRVAPRVAACSTPPPAHRAISAVVPVIEGVRPWSRRAAPEIHRMQPVFSRLRSCRGEEANPHV